MSTSSKVKRKYNKKAYDIITLYVPKGKKEFLKAKADINEMSLNAFIFHCVDTIIKRKEV